MEETKFSEKRQRVSGFNDLAARICESKWEASFKADIARHEEQHPWRLLLSQWQRDIQAALQGRRKWTQKQLLQAIRATDKLLMIAYEQKEYVLDPSLEDHKRFPHGNDPRFDWMSAFLRTMLYLPMLLERGVLLVRLADGRNACSRNGWCSESVKKDLERAASVKENAIRAALQAAKAVGWYKPGKDGLRAVNIHFTPHEMFDGEFVHCTAYQKYCMECRFYGQDIEPLTTALGDALGVNSREGVWKNGDQRTKNDMQQRLRQCLDAWPVGCSPPTKLDIGAWEQLVNCNVRLGPPDSIACQTADPLREFGKCAKHEEKTRHVWWHAVDTPQEVLPMYGASQFAADPLYGWSFVQQNCDGKMEIDDWYDNRVAKGDKYYFAFDLWRVGEWLQKGEDDDVEEDV